MRKLILIDTSRRVHSVGFLVDRLSCPFFFLSNSPLPINIMLSVNSNVTTWWNDVFAHTLCLSIFRYSRKEGYFDDIPKDKGYPKKLCFKFGKKAYGWSAKFKK